MTPTIESKQVVIKQRYYEQKERDVLFSVPQENMYFFKTGSRISVRVVPVWTKWLKEDGKEEEIWKLHITIVRSSFENKIEAFDVQISSIPAIFNSGKGEMFDILSIINDSEIRNNRTKEQFNKDFASVLSNLKIPKQ